MQLTSKYKNPYEMGTREYELFDLGLNTPKLFSNEELLMLTPRHLKAYLRGEFTPTFEERMRMDYPEMFEVAQEAERPGEWNSGSERSSTAPTQITTTPPQASTSTQTEAIASGVDMKPGETNYVYSSNPYLPRQQYEESAQHSEQAQSEPTSRFSLLSATGIEHLSAVLDLLESRGLVNVGSIKLEFNAFNSGIQAITLSSPSGMELIYFPANLDEMTDTVTQTPLSTSTNQVSGPFLYGQGRTL